jgi:GNAT superfamily N-acetyltransferase
MGLTLRSYEPGDERAILDLFRTTYGKELSPEYWRWRFEASPAGPAFIELAWDGPLLAAHYAVTQVALHVEGTDVRTGLSGTTMTHPDYRGRGLFQDLAKATYARMAAEGLEYVWGFPNTNSHRGFVEGLDWFDIYEVPTFEGKLEDMGDFGAETGSISEIATFDERFDALWERVRSGVGVRRDRAYLSWRLFDNPSDEYRVLAQRDALGYVALKRYRSSMQIVDLVYDGDVKIGVELARAAAMLARAEGCENVNTWMNVGSPLHRQLEKWGFRPTAPITYLGAAALRQGASDAIRDPRRWHFAMSDSDVY